jgi:hypothetical protein
VRALERVTKRRIRHTPAMPEDLISK